MDLVMFKLGPGQFCTGILAFEPGRFCTKTWVICICTPYHFRTRSYEFVHTAWTLLSTFSQHFFHLGLWYLHKGLGICGLEN